GEAAVVKKSPACDIIIVSGGHTVRARLGKHRMRTGEKQRPDERQVLTYFFHDTLR
ncbi:MAG: hypothetical protein RJA20_2142, partial [Bacteroidota bacterium]